MKPTTRSPQTPTEKLISSLRETTVRRVRQGLTAGAIVAAGTQGMVACVGDVIATDPVGELGAAGLTGDRDWAQQQGRRDTSMISYLGETWNECSGHYSRGGCGAMDVWVKLKVRPVEGADISSKHVGIVYRSDTTTGQSIARYFTTYQSGPDAGLEEWHASVRMPWWSLPGFTFNAWYQPGNGQTFYDDNEGELHPAMFRTQDEVIRIDYTVPTEERVRVDAYGIHGKVRAFVADLDPDKELELRYTTDGWTTSAHSFVKSDDPNATNTWHWVTDAFTGYDVWEINIDLPNPPGGEPYTKFWYALRYTHGVGASGARRYDFWSNNAGQDYRVELPAIQAPPQAPGGSAGE